MLSDYTRQEHLEWAKERAIAYAQQGDLIKALNSMSSDMQEHPETEGHLFRHLGFDLYIRGHLATPEKMINFIQEFN